MLQHSKLGQDFWATKRENPQAGDTVNPLIDILNRQLCTTQPCVKIPFKTATFFHLAYDYPKSCIESVKETFNIYCCEIHQVDLSVLMTACFTLWHLK